MSEPKNLRILMATPLDFDRTWNNREHNVLRFLAARGHRVTMLYRRVNSSKRIGDLMGDTCTWRVDERWKGRHRLVCVDSFFNYAAGIRVEADAQAQGGAVRWSPKYLIVRLMSPLRILRDVFAVPCVLATALRRLRRPYHVCIGFGPWGFLTAWVLQRWGRVKFTVYEDRDFEPGLVPDRIRRGYTSALERFGLRRADLVVCVSESLAALRRRQVEREVNIVPTGVQWADFASARDRQGHGHVLIHVGKVISWCGLSVVLEALPRILAAFPDARLMVVGDGPRTYVNHLKKMAQENGVESAVTFLGQRPNGELPILLAQADIGLVNSEPVEYRKYARPLKLAEYMAAGLPTLATEGTEAGELVTRYHCGIAAAYEPKSVADAVLGMFGRPGRMEEYRANAIRISQEWDWNRLLELEMKLIEVHLGRWVEKNSQTRPLGSRGPRNPITKSTPTKSAASPHAGRGEPVLDVRTRV